MDKHPFQGPDNGSCRYREGGRPCAYLAANEIHNTDDETGTTKTVRKAVPSGPRSLPAGRRAVPWSELPTPARLCIVFVLAGGGIVFVSACVALSYALLRLGGVVG